MDDAEPAPAPDADAAPEAEPHDAVPFRERAALLATAGVYWSYAFFQRVAPSVLVDDLRAAPPAPPVGRSPRRTSGATPPSGSSSAR